MPLTGPIPEGQSFFCPRCGALYSVTYSRRWKSVDIGDDDNGAGLRTNHGCVEFNRRSHV